MRPEQLMKTALMILLLGAWCCRCGAAEVAIGCDRPTLEREWGAPQGCFANGNREILLYPDGRQAILEAGKVVNLTPASGTAAAKSPSRQQPAAAPVTESPVRRPPARVAVSEDEPSDPPFVSCRVAAATVPLVPVAWSEGPDLIRLMRTAPGPKAKPPMLHTAALARRIDAVEELLAAGIAVSQADSLGQTVLHALARCSDPVDHKKHEAMIRLLIAKGADVNATDLFGQTPLHIAAACGSLPSLNALLAAGADPKARDTEGRTPAHLAVARRLLYIRDLLIAGGADPKAVDGEGLTTQDLIREQLRWKRRVEYGNTISALCFAQNRFFAAGPGRDVLLVTDDGINWKSQPLGQNHGCASLNPLAGGIAGFGPHGELFFSADGLTWSGGKADVETRNLSLACSSQELAVATGDAATIVTSKDGITWQSLHQGTAAYARGLCYKAGAGFYAMTKTGTVLHSLDGLHWGRLAVDLKKLEITRFRLLGDSFWAVGYAGLMLRSADAVHWQHVPTKTDVSLYDIAQGDGRYVAVGDRATVLLSGDGKTWRLITPEGEGDFVSVAYGDKTFVVTGRGGVWSCREK